MRSAGDILEEKCDPHRLDGKGTYDIIIDAMQTYASQFREPSTQGGEETIAIQDRMIGELTRDRDYYKDSYSRRQDWLRQAKAEAGADDSISFDNVWKDTLEKAKECERLKQENERLKGSIDRVKDRCSSEMSNYIAVKDVLQALNPKD